MARIPGKGFGFWTLTFLVVANMIGAGVFTTSGFTLASLGDPWIVLLAWFVGGLVALCGAFSYGILIQRMPASGGEYVFLSRAVHPFAGFMAGWISLLAGFSGAIAFAAVALESYLPGDFPAKLPAVGVVVLGAALHGGRRWLGVGVQNTAVILKLLLLGIFLGWGATSIDWGSDSTRSFQTEGGFLAFAQALVWISLSYSGFNAAVYVAGEATSPLIVARALVTGTAVVVLLYLLLNAAFVLGAPAAEISGQADVAAVAARWIGGAGFEFFTRVVISIALLTSVLSMMMAGPRVYGKMAEDGVIPKIFVLREDRVWPAVLLQMGLALLLIFVGTLQELLAFLGLTLSLTAAVTVGSLFFGKRVRGWAALPPALFTLATLTAASLLIVHDPGQALGASISLVLGGIAYRLTR
ncbi:MAG: amino acid permease [Akkermansiaceae bacterium]|jgi:amino acid transporter|nr:amino acid permease [Akkermansiaceae bacterium]MDB4459387.1 amino acid permease [bacterium]|tara:strand:+ start:6056 stop:7291 length:1236 start_codon:yes stop_codon:yes gene_type:complete